MVHLRQDHEELKAMYWAMKKRQQAKEDSNEVVIKTDSTTAVLSKNHEKILQSRPPIKMKRPARLLPNFLLRYLHSFNA